MQLLTKEDLQKKKSFEKKREIDEGVKLAKRVDDLRELSNKEYANLIKFRDESIESVKKEISILVERKNVILNEIKQLEERKIKESAPIDLTNEWQKVKKDKLELEEWKRGLFERETNLILREGKVITNEQDFESRNNQLIKNEKQAKQYLEESNKSYRVVEEIRNSIELRKEQFDKEISQKHNSLIEKEQKLSQYQLDLKLVQDIVDKDKKEILERGTLLIQRESQVESKQSELINREETLKENENLNLRYLKESKSNFEKTEELRLETEKYKSDSENDIKEKYNILALKEQELGYREKELNLEKEQIEKDKSDIKNERIHITSQQETLKVAWENIKKLQK